MQVSSVVLSDPESVWLDEEAKSIAYFCRTVPVRVDTRIVCELKEIATKSGGKNVRLCLHDSPKAPFHEMIILDHKGTYYRPHKHLTKSESYHMIEGSMAAFVLNEDGHIADACLLDARDNFIYRVGANMSHTVIPLSDLVIYHESKPGPFIGEGDSVYPSWAPDPTDAHEVRNYMKKLLEALRI